MNQKAAKGTDFLAQGVDVGILHVREFTGASTYPQPENLPVVCEG